MAVIQREAATETKEEKVSQCKVCGMDEKMVTTRELSEYLHVTVKYLRDMIDTGMPHYRLKKDGHYRFLKSEVATWISKNREN